MEGNILLFIQESIRNDFLSAILVPISLSGNSGLIWIALTIVLLFFKKTRKAGIVSAISLIFSLILVNLILKNCFSRVRPYDAISQIVLLVPKEHDHSSFPSGHSSASFASALSTTFGLNGKLKKIVSPCVIVYACLIAFSRLYVGVHYPTDVLGGIICGTICAICAYFAYKGIENLIKSKKKTRI